MNDRANGDTLSLYFAHQDQVQELPPGAELLGGSEFCPISLYSIADQVFAGKQAFTVFCFIGEPGDGNFPLQEAP